MSVPPIKRDAQGRPVCALCSKLLAWAPIHVLVFTEGASRLAHAACAKSRGRAS